MVIRKQYDIGQLAKQLQTEIEKSVKCGSVVNIDIITAYNILDVLNETNRREQKHQTLESALTNEMKESMDCFGDFDRRDEICVTCDCATLCRENTEDVEGKIKGKYTEGNPLEVSRYDDCFGEYKGEGNTKCLYCCLSDTCRDKTKNKEKKMVFFTENEDGTKEAKEVPRCYGNYKTRKSGFCNECQEATACKRASILRRKVTDE